jgi:PKD repeat protein
MKRRSLLLSISFVLILVFSACDLIPSDFNFGVNANIDVETTSDLGEDTLERIDAVNETIANGFEVGPETRDVINELNQTIKDGIKAGFDEETLARVDDLLRVVEDGLKIGLDDDTLNTIDGMVDTIDAMPGQWENSAEGVIRTLENSAGTAAGKMAKEVKSVINEARLNYQQMTAVTGIEFRCNVDFLGSKAGATVQEFIGKSIVGKIREIISGKVPESDILPTPWVCQIIPDKIVLSQVGDRLLFEESVITLTGYNYVQGNTPQASIQDENGQTVPGFHLPVYRTSPYQLQLNLQELDLSDVPARSRLVITFPNIVDTSSIAILLPASQAPVAQFTANPVSGDAPLNVQFTDLSSNNPTMWEWVFSDGATSNEQNPSHIFTDGGSFDVRLTASNNQGSSSVTQIINVDEALSADFTFSPNSGDVPLLVNFKDLSKGGPTSWHWDFGDGQTSDLPDPQHVYIQPNPEGYPVKLTVSNSVNMSEKTSPDRVLVMSPVVADFSLVNSSGVMPLTVNFLDKSQGDIIAWTWDFGDGSLPSFDQNPIHTYTQKGLIDVSLTVTRSDGETDTLVKNGAVNVQGLQLLLRSWTPPEQSIYFTSYQLTAQQQKLDTGISSENYMCIVSGLQILDGFIYGETNFDPYVAYTYWQYSTQYQKNTWWLTAGFPTSSTKWTVDVACLKRSMDGKLFTFRNDFKNIPGGEIYETSLLTSDYFNCSIGGLDALGPAQFQGYNQFNVGGPPILDVLLQAYMDGSGETWNILVDLPLKNEEKWNVTVLCFKRADYMLSENPPLIFGEITLPGGISNHAGTGISSADYRCAISGFSAERGDINLSSLNNISPSTTADPLFIRMIPENGIYNIWADIDTRTRDEDWQVKYWCARIPYGVSGTPPP